jgi:hypothetical protein
MPGAKNQKSVLVRMPANLHKRIIKLAESHKPPRSINSEIVGLLFEVTEWWEDVGHARNFSDQQLADMEATAKKMLASLREARTRKK